jgi:hypothetical protein
MMGAAIMSANTIQSPASGSDRPFRVAGWNLKAMNTQLFLVGYDRDTGFAGAIHSVPEMSADRARLIVGLDRDISGDWPLSSSVAREIASLIGTEINLATMEFCLEPHRDPEPAVIPVGANVGATNPK